MSAALPRRDLWAVLADMLDPALSTPLARLFRTVQRLAIVAGLLAMVAGTVPEVAASSGSLLTVAVVAIALLFVAEYLARAAIAVHGEGRSGGLGALLAWAASALAVVDLVAAVPVPLAVAAGAPASTLRLLAVVWVLKLVRYTPALSLLVRVVRSEAQALLGVAVVFTVVLMLAATGAYLLERNVQPQIFSSIPRALWWAIVTLTTTGYGDEVPNTLSGRLLGGVVMISGIALFALWAGILAGGFSREVRRRDFLRSWELVAALPMFRALGAAKIAEIAALLRPQDMPAGRVVVRKDRPGDCMYFIAVGEVEVDVAPRPVRIAEGGYFGELALVTGAPRAATVTTTRPCTLLQLDVVEFRSLAASHPELLEAIEARAAELRAGTV